MKMVLILKLKFQLQKYKVFYIKSKKIISYIIFKNIKDRKFDKMALIIYQYAKFISKIDINKLLVKDKYFMMF